LNFKAWLWDEYGWTLKHNEDSSLDEFWPFAMKRHRAMAEVDSAHATW
jgi:hypothetical protein